MNVSGYFEGIDTGCSIRAEDIAHSRDAALMYPGSANGGEITVCYFEVFDVDVPITADTKLSYWIYPQHDNWRFVGVDVLCTDGTTLTDSGSVDQNGVTMHPGHGDTIPLNTWSQIKCDVGQKSRARPPPRSGPPSIVGAARASSAAISTTYLASEDDLDSAHDECVFGA